MPKCFDANEPKTEKDSIAKCPGSSSNDPVDLRFFKFGWIQVRGDRGSVGGGEEGAIWWGDKRRGEAVGAARDKTRSYHQSGWVQCK